MGTRIIDAWNGWYHLNGNTYGTWIRGDERGWRARHHREHVDGDYKNPPPPNAYKREREFSMKSMGEPMFVPPEARPLACSELITSLKHQGIEPIACAVDDHHYHVLARFILPAPDPTQPPGSMPWEAPRTRNQPIYAFIRHTMGLAKSRATRAMSAAKHIPEGGLWAPRFKITAIADRRHQLNVFRYILDHSTRGAATWSIRSNPPTPPSITT